MGSRTSERLVQYGPELVTHFDARLLKLERTLSLVADLLTSRERTERYSFTGNTDSSGNATIHVKLEIATGFEFALHRLIVDDGVGTFAARTTGGSIEIQVNGQRIDGANLTAGATPGGLPAVFTASSSAGIFMRGGDAFDVALVGCGAHSKRVFGVAQGKLRRVPLGE